MTDSPLDRLLLFGQCPVEYHIHLDDKCLGVSTRCDKLAGHAKQGWHRSREAGVRWNFNPMDDPIHATAGKAGRVRQGESNAVHRR